ncbi:hypothetical protein FRZ06_20310 [Anoxybacterium hadale]|uniref:Uncharacterized protein n=1 Tax=Anoxybacterium hadale TaxID=3408580 RepID=A0ACD1AGB7_9FIRM|nr:hypothetical protein FRZ06_20310 [Clostridiales bacterium]
MAIFKVSPETNITSLIASDEVSQGDVLILEEGVYNQSVFISKSHIRIMAKNQHVVFDGYGELSNGFFLFGTTGVEVSGIKIQNYAYAGIVVIFGSANRILSNIIKEAAERGVDIVRSSANLVWKNEICLTRFGVLLETESTDNWIIENKVRDCIADCFESFFTESTGNAFISNNGCNSGLSCFSAVGANCLAYRNTAFGAHYNGVGVVLGRDCLAIENKSKGNGSSVNGTSNFSSPENTFIADNIMNHNNEIGLYVMSDYSIIQNNRISCNDSIGLSLSPDSSNCLIYHNRIECNAGEDIVDNGSDNNFIRNLTGCCDHWDREAEDLPEKTVMLIAESSGVTLTNKLQIELQLEKAALAKLEERSTRQPEHAKYSHQIFIEQLKDKIARWEALLQQ